MSTIPIIKPTKPPLLFLIEGTVKIIVILSNKRRKTGSNSQPFSEQNNCQKNMPWLGINLQPSNSETGVLPPRQLGFALGLLTVDENCIF